MAMHKRILLSILLILMVGQIKAQTLSATSNSTGAPHTSTTKLFYSNRNEPPRAMVFMDRTVATSYFLANINNFLNIPKDFSFTQTESKIDNLGIVHRVLQQHYKGIPIEGMIYRVHEKDGLIKSLNGKGVRKINLASGTNINEEQAFKFAVGYLQTKDTTRRNGKMLVVSKDFTFTAESFFTAYQFDIDVSLIERWRISIDAQSGRLINKVSLVNSCNPKRGTPVPDGFETTTGSTNYYGAKTIRVDKNGDGSQLYGQTENGGTVATFDFTNISIRFINFDFINVSVVSSPDNTYTTNYYKPAVSAQWATEQAYEYYFKRHNRNSFDDRGSLIKSYVHVDIDLDNAYWTGRVLAFGDGSNNNPLVELDVVGHELTHAVTQYEAHLDYTYEPGALNESFSDIFGKAIEFSVFGDTATWQLARHFQSGGLRDFSNPNLKNQPDTYFGDMWYNGDNDYGGVHTNSGVQNFWFYLLCNGGNGINDHQVNYSVNSIGMDNASAIAYRNLTEYLSSYSDYLDCRIGSLLATADLYGENSSTYQQVVNAWDAVGVIVEPIITDLMVNDITATTVKIKGSLEPRGDVVTYHFEYGTTPALGNTSPIYKYTDKVEGYLTGLQSKTKYYLRLIATNEHGSSHRDIEFTTLTLAPLVTLKQKIDITETTATTYGQVNPNSLPTSYYFEYGLTPTLGSSTPTNQLSNETDFINVSFPITNLQPRATYYYRLVATNGFATTNSNTLSFFTASRPLITSYTPASAPIGNEVTISGKNFNTTANKNLIKFGATRATVLSSNSTTLKVTVPAGASLSTISLLDTESGLATESIQEFVPVFNTQFTKGSIQLKSKITDLYIYQTLVDDIDGDGRPDIVNANYGGLVVLQNANTGGDITNESFVRNNFPAIITEKISLADFDGNGLKDILVKWNGNRFRVYPNYSAPGYIFFGAPVEVVTGYIMDIVSNDFDLDGHIDIATITDLPGDSVTMNIFKNHNPKGFISAENFEPAYSIILPYYVYRLFCDDLNNDGNPDLIVGTINNGFLPILKNISQSGDLGFEEIFIQDSILTGYSSYISQDLNKDGLKEIISLYLNLAIFQNKNSGSDIAMKSPVVMKGFAGASIAPGDLDGDGKVDMIVGGLGDGFTLLKNKIGDDGQIADSSFEIFDRFSSENNSNTTIVNVNDFNGDGRPEVIASNSYGSAIEVWQNLINVCNIDPSLVRIDNITRNRVTIVLPANSTFDQFQMEYQNTNTPSTWYAAYSTTLYLDAGTSYRLRVRAKCESGYTGYSYSNFTTECVDLESFYVYSIDVDHAFISANDLSYFEIQYSIADKDEWITQPWYSSQIWNLIPGTTYDIRFRGHCNTLEEYTYKQFTTLCPSVVTISIDNLVYNKATVSWTINYSASPIVEYSADSITWISIDNSHTIAPLIPGSKYFIRGYIECNETPNYTYKSFTTPCPFISSLSVDNVTPFSAKITWKDQSNTNDYLINYSLAGDGNVISKETSTRSFQIDELSPGTDYNVAVAAKCNSNENFTASTFTTICYSPLNLTVNSVTATTAELSWSADFSGAPYFVDYSLEGTNIWTTVETLSTNTSLAELRPGTKYVVKVHINCSNENAPNVSTTIETGLYDQTMFAPNPTDGALTIYPSKNLIGAHYSIYDSVGQKIAEGDLVNYIIDFSGFSIGAYVLKIEGEKPMKVSKR